MFKKIIITIHIFIILLTITSVYASNSIEYYWQEAKCNESYFDKVFSVTNSSHNYGEIYFTNEGTYNITVTVYSPTSLSIANKVISPFELDKTPITFQVETTGTYKLVIQNGGKENINGILTIKTFLQNKLHIMLKCSYILPKQYMPY